MSAEQYIDELQRERDVLDPQEFQHAIRLLETEIDNVGKNNNERYQPPARKEPTRSEPFKEEIIIVSEKILLPVEQYPKFNFVGRLLGPKGSTMKSLQEGTRTRISILGKGSTRDREKEEELSQDGDPKNEHFKEPLHIVVSAKARRSDAHERVATCLEEINKCMDLDHEGDRRSNEHFDDRSVHGNGYDIRKDSRGLGTLAPIIKVGIPPPGAIILNGPQSGGRGRGRGGGRGRDDRRSRPY